MFDRKNESQQVLNLNEKIEFTLLDARATCSDLEKMCDVAYKNQYGGVCVNSGNVEYVSGYVKKNFDGVLKIVSTVGFPLGATSVDVKIAEAKKALQDGADEIDVVINIGKAKNGDFDYVKNELAKLKKTAKRHVVKAIIETCFFDENEIVKLCKVCIKSKVDFVKTSTGFGMGGANFETVSLMRKVLAGKCKIKAAGGIRTREDAIQFVNLGADRIGASRIL